MLSVRVGSPDSEKEYFCRTLCKTRTTNPYTINSIKQKTTREITRDGGARGTPQPMIDGGETKQVAPQTAINVVPEFRGGGDENDEYNMIVRAFGTHRRNSITLC